MRKRRRGRIKRAQEGFALVVVVLLVVVMAVMGLSILQLIQLDLTLIGHTRQNYITREVVYGGAEEIRYATEIVGNPPGPATPNMQATYDFITANSVFAGGADLDRPATSLISEINYLRLGPAPNTDYGVGRKVVWEIGVVGGIADDISTQEALATAEVRLEVFKTVAVGVGNISPHSHYR